MDKAYKAVAYLELQDPELHARLVKHIKIETMFPKFALCTLHEASYTSTQMHEMRVAFMNDAMELGLVDYREHDGKFDTLFSAWGLQ